LVLGGQFQLLEVGHLELLCGREKRSALESGNLLRKLPVPRLEALDGRCAGRFTHGFNSFWSTLALVQCAPVDQPWRLPQLCAGWVAARPTSLPRARVLVPLTPP